MAADIAELQKLADPYTLIRAEEFFESIQRPASGVQRPTAVESYIYNAASSPANNGLLLKFDDGNELRIRFIQPKVWKLHPKRSQTTDSAYTESHSYERSTTVS